MIRTLIWLAGWRIARVDAWWTFRRRLRHVAWTTIVRAAPTCRLWERDELFDFHFGGYRFRPNPRWVITDEDMEDFG